MKDPSRRKLQMTLHQTKPSCSSFTTKTGRKAVRGTSNPMKRKPPRFVLVAACVTATLSCAAAADTNPPPFFQEAFSFPLGEYWCENHLSVADVDGDGRQDIVLMATALSDPNGPPWQYTCRAILLRAGPDGAFTDSVITNFPGRYGYAAVTADLNNDGAADLILREQSATHVLLNDGDGAFAEVWTGQPGYYNLTTVDVNHDGFLDVVSGTQTGSGGLIELFTNNGAGTSFTKTWQSRYYGSGYDSIQTVVSVNLNDDEEPDIAALEIYSGSLVTLRGTNTGVPFVEQNVMALGDRTFALAAGRVNGGAVADLAAHVGWGTVHVFTNRGDGSMATYWQSPNLGQAAFNLALSDFDRDGFDDLFVGTFGDGALRIYRNDPAAGFAPWWQGGVPGNGYTGSVADLNGDGCPDLIVGEASRIRILINACGNPLFIGNVTVKEGDSGTTNALFTVGLVSNHAEAVSVDFATVDGSATAGLDYFATNGTLVFNPGEVTQTIAVRVVGDVRAEADETFFLRFSNATNLSLVQTQASATILEDDLPPRIIAQPSGRTVLEGEPVSLVVRAIGALPLAYEWRKDGAALNGETNTSLTIPNAHADDAGSYSVLVTNAFGSVTSAVAPLTIGARLAISRDGGGVFIRSLGQPDITYEWQSATNVTGPWTTRATTVPPPTGLLEFRDTISADEPQRYYRIVVKGNMPTPTSLAYLTSVTSHLVTVVDLSLNQVLTNIPVAGGPHELTVSPDGSKVCVSVSTAVKVIDVATQSITETIPVDGGGEFASYPRVVTAFSPGGDKLFAATIANYTLHAFGIPGYVLQASLPLDLDAPLSSLFLDVKVTPSGDKIFVGGRDATWIVNASTLELLTTLTNRVKMLAMHPDGTRAYLARSFVPIRIFDVQTHVETDQITYSTTPGYNNAGMALSPDGGFLYVLDNNNDELAVIDTTGKVLVKKLPLAAYGDIMNYLGYSGIAVSADGTKVYVPGPDKLIVIETAGHTVSGTIPLGFTPPSNTARAIALVERR